MKEKELENDPVENNNLKIYLDETIDLTEVIKEIKNNDSDR